ncbi:helix-turn-helix transcriptional regulator [Variovorax sp. Sphag1AA]|uniref:helix-turn-helix transcriptional regulator n=1 Tax=Variovorax sp. Sphag1AA TaxID=2587027 RepID=UPI0016181679|nr:helix-turn-helix transcriptional regulator [Variovorax sp. Sphag1AA]MBB3180233.1 DNA-binding CsgD family transcriptional regulator [Variovorax sp. Sphag1AA]
MTNVLSLYELANAASLDAAKWPALLHQVAQDLGALGGAIFTPGVDATGPHLGIVEGTSTNLSGYKSYWAAHDPWLQAVAGKHFFETAGEVRFGSEFLSDAGVQRSIYYNEYGRFGGAGHKLALKVCDASDPFAPVTHLVVGRPFGERPFTQEDRHLVRRYWAPVQHAIRMHWRVSRDSNSRQDQSMALDALPMPALVLREDAQIEFANAPARQLLRDGGGVRQVHNSLVQVGSLEAADLHALVRRSGPGPTKADSLIADGGNIRRLVVCVSQVRESPAYAAAWPRAKVLMVLLDGCARPEDEVRWLTCLGSHFRLTTAERFILERIAAGRTVEEIAHEKSVIPATVRTHLTSIFDKTGRRRQSDLVRLVHGR